MVRSLQLLSLLAIAAALLALPGCEARATSSTTWQGRDISVSATGSASIGTDTSPERAIITVNNHTITLTDTQITVNDATHDVGSYERVEIEVDGETLTVTVDGTAL